jgi:transglutaminase-like putative cysteine protease
LHHQKRDVITRAVNWAWDRYRPDEGWLPFLLLAGAVMSSILAVLEVEWVPEAGAVIPAAMLGLLMGVALAKRPLHGGIAWLLITAYGLLITVTWLAQLLPPLRVLLEGWWPTSHYWRQNGALFMDRAGSWLDTVLNGGRSQETIVFASGLMLLAWLLAAYTGWSTFRQRRPLLGLTAMGLAVSFNGYFGRAPIWSAALFVAFAVLITAVMHLANLEQDWLARGVDFSDQIRLDLVMYSGAIALLLLLAVLAMPTIRISSLSRALRDIPIVKQAEDTLERVFAGVRQPPRGGLAAGGDVEGFAGGGMPRAYLLGNPPELYETVVLTATVSLSSGEGDEGPVPAGLPSQVHWRGLSYDIYTGSGWARSDERVEIVSADQPIPSSSAQRQTTVHQSVNWLFDSRTVRYTLGLPLFFDQAVSTHWRGLEDLVWAEGKGTQYRAASLVSMATRDELSSTAVAEVPLAIMAQYSDLPATVPVRVHELAQEIAGAAPNPYEQARALERFLRQYTYSLEVDLPPNGVDPVDFFLFEQQAGYCDYYASAMTVMARSLGLPARIGVGFLPQPPDENGVQTIYQIDGHSWAEIYFPGYGWIEFEPTAAFPSPHDSATNLNADRPFDFDADLGLPFPQDTPAIPEPDPQRPFPWRWVGLAGIVAFGLWLGKRRRVNAIGSDGVSWAYGRLQRQAIKLGHPTPASQTPSEFATELQARLSLFADRPRLAEFVAGMRPHIERLTDLFIIRQYSRNKEAGTAAALDSWYRLRWPMWLLRTIAKVWRVSGRSSPP